MALKSTNKAAILNKWTHAGNCEKKKKRKEKKKGKKRERNGKERGRGKDKIKSIAPHTSLCEFHPYEMPIKK